MKIAGPSWQVDPDNSNMERWWDGIQWCHTIRRAPAPALWPVVLFSILFGFFGIIAALVQGTKASKVGHSQTQYWATWAVIFGIYFVLFLTLNG
jgi:hypothetical protein